MTTHLLLRGESLEALKAQVVAEHGPSARILKAESVVQGGIGGFLAKRYFEVTVEVPTAVPTTGVPMPSAPTSRRPTLELTGSPLTSVPVDPGHAALPAPRGMVLPRRSGIAALLADADEAEDRLADPVTLSTSSQQFDQLFDELSARVSPAPTAASDWVAPVPKAPSSSAVTASASVWAPAIAPPHAQTQSAIRTPTPTQPTEAPESPAVLPPAVPLTVSPALVPSQSAFPAALVSLPASQLPRTPPLPSQSAGDLVLLVGLRTDALRVAHSLSGRFGPAAVCVGGTITLKSAVTVSDRRSALRARADGVQNGCSAFVAYGIEPDSDWMSALRDIGADQVWVVVDAGRKHEDTKLWVQKLASTVEVDAVAAFGLALTLTPETVQDLGAPVGWADGLLLGG